MTRRKTAQRRLQQAVATMTHTADVADVVTAFRTEVEMINTLAAEGHARITAANINDNALRLAETRRVETLRKTLARQANELLLSGYQRVGVTGLGRRLAEGYEYVYLPIVGTDGKADETQADVWRKAVSND